MCTSTANEYYMMMMYIPHNKIAFYFWGGWVEFTYQHMDSARVIDASPDIRTAAGHQFLDKHMMCAMVFREYQALLNDSHLVDQRTSLLHCQRHMLARNVQDEL